MKKHHLIIAYYSYQDPVFQSAVLPYFKGLLKKSDQAFILLTFEQRKYSLSEEEILLINKELNEENMLWYRLTWRSGRFKIVKKIVDFALAFYAVLNITRRHKILSVYSEGFPGAVIGHYLAVFMGRPHIVHTFEPHTRYMIEAGVWKDNSLEVRLLSKWERTVARGASVIMTATKAYIDELKKITTRTEYYRVPSCVDLSLFTFQEDRRASIRKDLGVADNECLVVYLGKTGGMYMDSELTAFFCFLASRSRQVKFKFLILTPDDPDMIREMFYASGGMNREDLAVMSAVRRDVPGYLSAADFGFVAVKQKPAKRFCSPIKDGEYWACGLPVIIPEGISDDYLLAKEYGLGIVMKNTTQEGFAQVLEQVETWFLSADSREVRNRCRDFAEQDRSVKAYRELFKSVFEKYSG